MLVHNAIVKKKVITNHSFELDLNQRPMDYKFAFLQSTALSTELSKVDDREWLFISCELLVHNAFVKKKKKLIIHSFEPDLNQRPMDYKLTLLQSTALPTELSKV